MNTAIRLILWLVVFAAATSSGCQPNKSNRSEPDPNSVRQATTADAGDAAVSTTVNSDSPASTGTTDDVKAEPSVAANATPETANEPEKVATAVNDDQSLQPENSHTEQPSTSMSPTRSATKPATWTADRIVIMGKGGPIFLKLDVNVGNQDLEIGFRSALGSVAEELHLHFEEPIDWNTLLDNPLIASGWLGNLVPGSDQRDQLRGLYDKNGNGKVDEAEFHAFVTRGISRSPHLKLIARPGNAPQLPWNSVWGPIDVDENGELTAEELAQASKNMLRFDFDGDNSLNIGELLSVADSDRGMSSPTRSSLLDLRPVHEWDPLKTESMVRAVFDHYSFGESLTSEMLSAWPPQRWKRLDKNVDAAIDLKELRSANDEELDGLFQISLPDFTQGSSEKLNVNYQTIEHSLHNKWLGHPSGGRLTLDGCIVTVLMNDEQDDGVKQNFKAQFGRLEKDAQFQSFVYQALELKTGAMELLKTSSSERHVEAVDLAWRWLVGARHWHVQIGWSTSDSPWFELMDVNGDRKLAVTELDHFAAQAQNLDVDKDGVIQAEEMPISVLLEIKRGDARGLRSRLGGTTVEKRGANVGSAPTWFTGMDYNSDGELSLIEFFGDQSDFDKFDLDRNGIIEAREVTTPQ